MSPFEHLTLTVKISVPLYIRSQIMRHRTFAYNEISRRYTDKNLEFYVPNTLRKQHSNNRQASEGEIDPLNNEILATAIMLHQSKCLEFYNLLIEKGVCREQARGVLPQNLMTEFYMTGNLRNWAHFIELRQHEGAQYEVQLVANDVKKILIDKFGYAAEVLMVGKNESNKKA
jgi:thymidylate synthase (FAD)